MKQRDVFSQPKKIIDASIGFDLEASQNIKYRNDLAKLKRRDKKNDISIFEQIQMHFKIAMDPKNLNGKVHSDGHSGKTLGIPRLDNRVNSSMNNVMSHDFAMRDWIDDTDLMLPRMSAEFPRMSEVYTGFESDQKRPWGDKR